MTTTRNNNHVPLWLVGLACSAVMGACTDAVLREGSPLALAGLAASVCILAFVLFRRYGPVAASASVPSEVASPDARASVSTGTKGRIDSADEPSAARTIPQSPQALVPASAKAPLTESNESATTSAPTTKPEPLDQKLSDQKPLPYTMASTPLPPGTSSRLDFPALSDRLVDSADPLSELCAFVSDIRAREQGGMAPNDAAAQPPCDLERYAARVLEEAGLFSDDVDLPTFDVIRPRTSRMVYLRCTERRISHRALMRLIKLEAALNALRFASSSLPPDATEQEAYLLNQRLATSVIAQAAPISEPPELPYGSETDGEWAVRYGVSQAVETLQLPYRLATRYRSNVADGNVAIEFDFTPADAFPSSCLVDGIGIVPTTGDMRQKAAADYALRVAILLAASAFRCSERIRHVWVAAVHDNSQRRLCYLSVDFDRWRFARLDLQDVEPLTETYRSFAALVRLEDGWLRPVRQGFYLEEERFCPKRRFVPVSLSSRRLKGDTARQLGCDNVSSLAIEEADGRALIATAIMMRLAPQDDREATQKNVRTVLELAGDDPDPSVRSAAERVVRGLVDGTLSPDAWTVGEEFVRGDALTRTADRAKVLLMSQDPQGAHDAVAPLVARIDGAGLYRDSSTVVYRYFGSYAERALFNRIEAARHDHAAVILVPDAYYEAHLLVSVTALMLGNLPEAIAHGQRLCELAPLDARSRLQMVSCLEHNDQHDEAMEELRGLLERGYEPMGIGLAYYRMASFQWRNGRPQAAQACYERAMEVLPGSIPMIAMELSMLLLQSGGELAGHLSHEQIEETLVANGIPLAPTETVSAAFYECAQASLDAEIFPVAKNFTSILGAFTGDDVIAGVIRSLEDAPDR